LAIGSFQTFACQHRRPPGSYNQATLASLLRSWLLAEEHRDSDADHLIQRQALELDVSLAALIVSLVTSNRQARLQYEQDDQKLFAANLDTATNDTLGTTRRLTSIWTLSSFWHDDKHEQLLAETLSALLTSPGYKTIGLAAADAIGLAITDAMDEATKSRRAALLYGTTGTWNVGTVIRQQKFLMGSDTHPCSSEDNDDYRVEATRQAIRRNWEYLRNTHFWAADLTGARLYLADLSGAFLRDAKLNRADLRGASVEAADLTDTCVSGANIQVLLCLPSMQVPRVLSDLSRIGPWLGWPPR
jgi:Pentapeptide repeats (8 copies)